MARISDIRRMMQMSTPHQETVTDDAVASFVTDFPAPAMVKAEFSPVQDLLGYANPWPAGGGVNLIPDGTDTAKGYVSGKYLANDGSEVSQNAYNISEYFPVVAGADYVCSKYTDQDAIAVSVCFYDSNYDFIGGEKYNNRTYFVVTAPSNASYMRSTLDSNSSQTAKKFLVAKGSTRPSAWSPYRNVCPISGWTGTNISNVAGKNFFDPNSTNAWYYSVNGKVTQAGAKECHIRASRGEKYIFSIGERLGSGAIIAIAALDIAGNILTRQWSSGQLSVTVTCPENTYYISASISVYANVTNPQFERGDTVTTYEAYRGSVLPISWQSSAGTVYGGTLTIHEDGTGTLTVSYGKYVFSGEETSVPWGSQGARLFYVLSNAPSADTLYTNNSICDKYKTAIRDDIYSASVQMSIGTGAQYIAITGDIYDDIDQLVGAAIVYPLTEPITYPLSASQIKTLLGTNNVWTDLNGGITVRFFKHG